MAYQLSSVEEGPGPRPEPETLRIPSTRRRVTYGQLEALWEFLNTHNEVAVGYNKTAHAREHSKRIWQLVAEALNSHGDGAIKNWKGWSNYWVDYKAKLKRKCAAVRASLSRTGGGPSDTPPLSEVEKKFEALLGAGFGTGLPTIQINPFPSVPTVHIPNVEDLSEPPPPTPPQSTSRTSRNGRRRRRQDYISQEAARRTLVNISQTRLEIAEREAKVSEARLLLEERNASVLEAILSQLTNLSEKL